MFEKLGKFEIKRLLGQGSMGEVYLGVDPSIGREVAIKTILSTSATGQEAKDRFAREAKAAGLLNHPNLVTIHEFGEDQGVLYIAMEYVKGNDLEELILNNSLTSSEALEVLAQVCDGLAFAHKNHIVHRDIKPSNIRIFRDGKRLHVKVLDFGVARTNNSDMTATGMVVGTVSYMAPEYIRTGTTDPRGDLFAVGVMLYETLSGRKPFSGGTMPMILYKIMNDPPEPIDLTQLHGISPSIRSVLDRALCKDPDLRYQTAEEFANTLRAAKDPTWAGIAQGDTVWVTPGTPAVPQPTAMGITYAPQLAAAKPPPLPGRSPAKPTKVPIVAIAVSAIGALFILLGAGGFAYWRWKKSQEPSDQVAALKPGNTVSASGKMDDRSTGNSNIAFPQAPSTQATPQITTPPVARSDRGKVRQGSYSESAGFEGNSGQHYNGSEIRETTREPKSPKSSPADPTHPSTQTSDTTKAQGEETTNMPEVANGKALAWTVNRVYKSSETIEVIFKNIPESRNSWIDISRADDRDGKYRQYYWTYGKPNGKMTFSGLNLEPGAYEVRVHLSRSNSVDQRFPFRVK